MFKETSWNNAKETHFRYYRKVLRQFFVDVWLDSAKTFPMVLLSINMANMWRTCYLCYFPCLRIERKSRFNKSEGHEYTNFRQIIMLSALRGSQQDQNYLTIVRQPMQITANLKLMYNISFGYPLDRNSQSASISFRNLSKRMGNLVEWNQIMSE